jgi:hypothetical protein
MPPAGGLPFLLACRESCHVNSFWESRFVNQLYCFDGRKRYSTMMRAKKTAQAAYYELESRRYQDANTLEGRRTNIDLNLLIH